MQTVGSCDFSRETVGLPVAAATEIVNLADGDTYALTAAPVRKRIGDAEVRMLAYNGSVPGPVLRVRQGATVDIAFTNAIDLESTVHWHGLRLDNRFDGTHETQAPVRPGETFRYRVTFPDAGLYWYHPHIREDYGQELGLAGTVLVEPSEAAYWAPVHREAVLVLDDILLEDGQIAPFHRDETNYVAMGRFGNALLVNGEPDIALTANRDEVIRFYLVNTANTRTFNIGFRGARMKLAGGDSGRVEREQFVESVTIAPSERVVVEVRFDQTGQATLEHRTPGKTAVLGTVTVCEAAAAPSLAEAFETLRSDADLTAERQTLGRFLAAAPDRTLAFAAEMNMAAAEDETAYVCPMHPEITSDAPASCPICGMKLLPASLAGGMDHAAHDHHGGMDHGAMLHEHHGGHETLAPMDHHGHGHHEMGHATHDDGTNDGIEWEDDMEAVNRMTTPANTRWTIVDRTTGAANHAIDWQLKVGDRVKIRLVNEMDSDHPMHHPFHIHGAGRFLILSRNGAAEPNLAWKDTVLVRTGETVDILLDVTNPGIWMAHCHIAEHHESGMMFSFHVTP